MGRVLFQFSLLIPTVFYAFLRGGLPERVAAMIILSMYPIDWGYHAIWGNVTVYSTVNLGHLLNDAWLLLAMTVLTLRANRRWVMWLASVQLIAVIAHFVRWKSAIVDEDIYAAFTRWTSYFQIALLFAGTLLHHRRTLRGINTPSWRVF